MKHARGEEGDRPVLDEAADIVYEDRMTQYGPPSKSFGRIASAWGSYLGVEINEHDVAMMMVILKVSRARAGIETTGSPQRDSLVDIAGYVACADVMMRGE